MTKPDIDAIEDAASFIQCTIDAKKRDATKTKKLTCVGTLCGGSEFDSADPGCCALLHFCAACNAAIRAELAGA